MKLLVYLLCISIFVHWSFGCKCARPQSAAEAFRDADYVFVGKIESVRETKNGTRNRALVKVEKNFKGEADPELFLYSNIGGAACGFPLQEDGRILVYTSLFDSKFHISSCGRSHYVGNTDVKKINYREEDPKVLEEKRIQAEYWRKKEEEAKEKLQKIKNWKSLKDIKQKRLNIKVNRYVNSQLQLHLSIDQQGKVKTQVRQDSKKQDQLNELQIGSQDLDRLTRAADTVGVFDLESGYRLSRETRFKLSKKTKVSYFIRFRTVQDLEHTVSFNVKAKSAPKKLRDFVKLILKLAKINSSDLKLSHKGASKLTRNGASKVSRKEARKDSGKVSGKASSKVTSRKSDELEDRFTEDQF